MKHLVLCIGILFLLIGSGCQSKEEMHLIQLMEELDIVFTEEADSTVIVIIPGNGCGSCIQDAIDEMTEFEDTAYVFICDSPKDFYLQSKGKQASSFKNLYLDKQKVAFRLNLVQTYPMVYMRRDGKLVSSTPYKSLKRMTIDKKPTTVMLNKPFIDLGKIKFGHTYKDSIHIINTGKASLYIKDIRTSCECTKVKCDQKVIPPLGTEVLYMTFRPDARGEFERFIYIDCNVNEQLLEIPVKGIIN